MENQDKYIEKLRQENEKLSRKNFSLTRELNETKQALIESESKVSELLDEMESLETELADVKAKLTPVPTLKVNPSVREFLSPKIDSWGEASNGVGLEKDWDFVTMVFTDQIFVDSDQPDLPLYYDFDRGGFRSFQGSTFLKCPITSEKLSEIGVIKVRKPTEKELEALRANYNL